MGHHRVYKPGPTSTKCRVVTNLSLDNNNQGFSLKDCLPEGPNCLILLFEAAIAWRGYLRVTHWDYTKCYNSVYITKVERHLRRFI